MERSSIKILVADDEIGISNGLKAALVKNNYQVDTATDGFQAEHLIKDNLYNVVITDLKMPGRTGLQLLSIIKDFSPDTAVILITAYGSVTTAVEAIKKGAYDYITKPINIKRIRILVRNALEYQALVAENKELRSRLQVKDEFETIVGKSDKMKKVYTLIDQVSPSDVTVLIQGESGTGKELIARAIHQKSPRGNKPFISLNCGAIPESLFETELFGHIKGAFTGAHTDKEGRFDLAEGGTLFLDEVSDMPLKNQVDFLRVLEEKEFRPVGGAKLIRTNVRVIAASKPDLADKVKAGLFRDDLYYRLNVIPIPLPPLTKRKEDIPLLVDLFLNRFSNIHHYKHRLFSPEAMKIMVNYPWPGNVRELQNTIERIVITQREKVVSPRHLPAHFKKVDGVSDKFIIDLGLSLKEVEKKLIQETLTKVTSKHKEAAKVLGLSLRALQYKLKEYDLL